GHHPTEVIGAIQAVEDFYPEKRIVWVYQPHHHNRTKELFNDFVKSFGGVDVLLMSDIYDVAGREEAQDQDIHSKILAKEIEAISPNVAVYYTGDLKQTRQAVDEYVKEGDVVVFQGAGTIDEIARDLIK
ncbi:UDP-N-acetylmuramate--L-alanine ligase, partial [Candidatus Saccharibacteria bacterium]|nr:UDP-N-acetylmuramate--L-alanine ligase [Candidatus Saccharibacteria bacterium]NIV04306.1 UDP-N-acetylmuramate--L-alanine ligase [Calditrichia bacterium]NIS38858.1 UDP-N-acetylmuramate--L-alanine ligase [Candidatus Saccharibacteria bacterium]NIV72806.1 UDP-N-acetylmuramate--L-alanine ligase [Calditrichia bacterium]NIV99981.1 UDP-N-acetylmuramate--L-alanine ligase [Candidatus Saccharibacteria bacterium]